MYLDATAIEFKNSNSIEIVTKFTAAFFYHDFLP